MSHRLLCLAAFLPLLVLLIGCNGQQPAPPPAAPAPAPATDPVLEQHLRDTEVRLRRAEDALAKSQDAIRDLQARAKERPAANPAVKPPQQPPPPPRPEPVPQITLAKFNAVEVREIQTRREAGDALRGGRQGHGV